MELRNNKILLTGGAGFIGSHLADRLTELKNHVTVIDNFSGGDINFIKHLLDKPNFELIEGDILKYDLTQIKKIDIVFHLAANPDIRKGYENTSIDFEQNLHATFKVLEAMRNNKIPKIIFTSTSTVYGEAEQIPTPEDYGPLIPISLYASSKLGCEAMISAYCYNYSMDTVLCRFANCVGPRSTHGVTFDFVNKLTENPNELEILGDGTQMKSYFHVTDCINAMIFALENKQDKVGIFNIGSTDYIDVKTIANIVSKEMGLNPKYNFTGGVDGGRGWKGDVKVMLLSIEKLKKMGWTPKYNSSESIRLTARNLLEEKKRQIYNMKI